MGQTSYIGKTATTVVNEHAKLSVVYHQTEVVKVNYNTRTITLKTGGWKTVTTKLRMNQASNQFALGYRVYQKKGKWFVSYNGIDKPFLKDIIIIKMV